MQGQYSRFIDGPQFFPARKAFTSDPWLIQVWEPITRPEPIAPSQIEIDAPEVPEGKSKIRIYSHKEVFITKNIQESVSRGKEDLPPSYDDILNEW